MGFIMSLKKYLIRLESDSRGQIFVEYFILFVAIATLVIVASTKANFFNQMKKTTSDYTVRAFDRMVR
jgi:hypothetical protein